MLLASSALKCHSTVREETFLSRPQALISARKTSVSGILRSRHCMVMALSSISALGSQRLGRQCIGTLEELNKELAT